MTVEKGTGRGKGEERGGLAVEFFPPFSFSSPSPPSLTQVSGENREEYVELRVRSQMLEQTHPEV